MRTVKGGGEVERGGPLGMDAEEEGALLIRNGKERVLDIYLGLRKKRVGRNDYKHGRCVKFCGWKEGAKLF